MYMKTKMKYLFILLITASVCMLSSCEVDYYNPSPDQESDSKIFEDGVVVPSDFNWVMTQGLNLKVSVDDQFEGKYFYQVDVFDGNPLFDDNVQRLFSGVAKFGQPIVANIVTATATKTLYVQQTNPMGGKTLAAIDISSSSLNYSFSTETKTKSVETFSSASNKNVEVRSNPTSLRAENQYSVPNNATPITQTDGQLGLDLGKGPFVIDGNFKGTTNFWGTGEVYVTGNFHVTSNFQIPYGSKLIVLDGGTVTIDGEFLVSGSALFYNNGATNVQGLLKITNPNAIITNDAVINAGSLELATNPVTFNNNAQITISGNSKISNQGKITNNSDFTTQSLTLDNGLLDNFGTIIVAAETSATNQSVKITNNGTFTTNTFTMKGNAAVYNNCHLTVIDQITITDSKIYNGAESLFATAQISMNNARIELGSSAMMKITNLATFDFNPGSRNFGFFGTGKSKALLQIKKAVPINLDLTKNNIIHYQGNLEIECYDHPQAERDSWNTRWTQSGVTWAGEGGSSVVIESTDCNGGGFNNNPTNETPQNPIFPIIFDGTSLTYLFEDNWPSLGDFDMNDLVFDVKPTYTANAENKITQFELNVTLRAVGASIKLAAGLQLDGITPAMIQSVSRTNNLGINGRIFNQNNGLENGQTFAVLPLFDEAHLALGNNQSEMINTIAGSANNTSPLTVSITVNFKTAIEKDKISVEKFNPFIINGGTLSKRQEVHLPGYDPTDKVNRQKFGSMDDNSNSGRKYTSRKNLIWGLAIPGSALYPKEWTPIGQCYLKMADWATSSGLSSTDWYKSFDDNKIFK